MYETEVQAGIAVAEEKGLDWKAAALSPFFDIVRADSCILGLTMGGYWRAKQEWDVDQYWMECHGFLTPESLTGDEWNRASDELGETWRRAARGELVNA